MPRRLVPSTASHIQIAEKNIGGDSDNSRKTMIAVIFCLHAFSRSFLVKKA